MPIRAENRDRYPADWAEISRRIKVDRADGRCECEGECGMPGHAGMIIDTGEVRCLNQHGQPSVYSGKKVVLTTAHLDHTPEHCDDDNLKAMCQGCHLHYDRDHHAQTRAATRVADREAHGLVPLVSVGEGGKP